MATCFLFVEHLTGETCLSLRLDDQGRLDAPLEHRSFESLRALQINARTHVVLPTTLSSLHQVELPWLGERRARAALPYALEEQVAQPVTSLHVAFDQHHYDDNHYLVAVTDKAFLLDLMTRFDELDLSFDIITLDWFALDVNEIVVSQSGLLIHDKDFKGALTAELAGVYLAALTTPARVFVFNDSLDTLDNPAFTHAKGSVYEWLATRLFKTKVLNLCQGDCQHKTRQQTSARWYQMSGILVVLWFVGFLITHTILSHQLTNQLNDVDQKIAVIYREFFPQAQQVISPKFRIEQLLKGENDNQDAVLWQLLDKLALAVKPATITIEQMLYQNQVLSVSLTSSDFATLNGLELDLKKAGVNVTQAQASSQKQKVSATLELRL